MKKLCAIACLSVAVLSLDTRPASAWFFGGCECGCYRNKCCQYNAFSPYCCECCTAPCGCFGLWSCCRPLAYTPCCPPCYGAPACGAPYGGCYGGACPGGACYGALPPGAIPAAPVAGPAMQAVPGVAGQPQLPAGAIPVGQALPPGAVPMTQIPNYPMPYPMAQPTSYNPGMMAPYGMPMARGY